MASASRFTAHDAVHARRRATHVFAAPMARSGRQVDSSQSAVAVKRVLMVAYHFPPMSASSGIQRTLRFAQHLPEFNWEPLVLTAHPRAYSHVSQASLGEVPSHLHVRRAFALDTTKHLSLRGAYPR